MKNTRLMELMFSDTTSDELKEQVGNDIKEAEANGVVDTEEVKYEKQDNGDVAITDKETGEVTLASKNPDEADTYDLIAVPDGQLERFVHPSANGKPGSAMGAPDEKVESHMVEGVIAPNLPDGGKNPEAGNERKVTDICPECIECGEGEKEFSVTSDNVAWQRLFSYPLEFIDKLFSETIDSCETTKVGDLKIERCADEDDAVVVTSVSTGDQVKVKVDDENLEVEELDSKGFSEDEQFLPIFVVGVQPYDHIIVEAQEYDMESAEQLKAQLEEDGVEAVEIFEDPEQTREYAYNLLTGLNASPAANEATEEKEFSSHYGCPRFFSVSYDTEDSVFMTRIFSEEALGVTETRDAVEDAIRSGEPVEVGSAIITPIDEQNAIVQDANELTKASIEGEDMLLEKIDEDEAQALLGGESEINVKAEEGEKEFSYYTNDEETRFFSEGEPMTSYMIRLFSEEADQNHIEAAIESGEIVETEAEVITPVDDETAVVEDKENGEFTKVSVIDEDRLNVHPISEDEADNLLGDVNEAPGKEGENALAEEEDEIKNYSEIYDWTNENETRFFSEGEPMTSYMIRLFSEEADQEVIEEALKDGKQIENDTEVVTPVSATTAIVEDKENGEFTKITLKNDEEMEADKISEEEADKLTEDLKVEAAPEDEEEENKEEKAFSENDPISKFFAEVVMPAQAASVAPAAAVPAAPVAAPAQVPVQEEVVAPAPTAEDIEDKALAAIQSIKAVVEEGTAQIMEAKAAPAPNAEPEIQEAQFSEKTFSQNAQNDTLISWLQYK